MFRVIQKTAVIAILAASLIPAQAEEDLAAGFANPPQAAKPWVYWFWLNGNITKEGITADLEAMQRAGIGGVLIMEVDQGVPVGPVDFMGAQWRELFKFMVAEASRCGIEVNMNNDAGWNGSGGPWITPELSMQKVVWSEMDIEGPQHFEGALPQPETIAGYYRDIAMLAFPTPGPYRIENVENKACYKSSFVPPAIAPEVPVEMTIPKDKIIELTAQMKSDGSIAWDAPAGKWTIMRFGHTSTGVENAPAPATGRGLECDKLSKEGIEANFNGMMGKLIADVGEQAGKALIATHIDSWENGAQNWTAKMRQEFQERRGYDLLPFMPAFSGRVVESLDISERFLWDLRQTVSDLLVENYAEHMQTLAHQHGLRFTVEAYGGPCFDLPYAGRSDEPMGEFWIGGSALNVCKGMASAAHVYGKPILGAEAFTADNHERWLQHPATFKELGDRAFCLGVNRFVFHRYALQPWQDRRPGMTMGPWGLHYERTNTWWDWSPAWHQYLARCQYLLRQGLFVADICYVQPETAPQGAEEHSRAVYDYDTCSVEVVLARMSVRDGRVVLPDGMSYRLLVLPHVPTMTPAFLRKVKELVEAGATVLGPRPAQSPSLTDYPHCDEEVKQLAREIWGDDSGPGKEHVLGRGRVEWDVAPEELLAQLGTRPDFTSWARLNYLHRRMEDADLYFVANPRAQQVTATCSFRVTGKRPELWWPDSGRRDAAAVFAESEGATNVVLDLEPSGSVFVVFREQSMPSDPLVAVARGEETLLSAVKTAPKLLVEKAVYGVPDDPQRTRDVRDAVQRLVDAGEYSFNVARLAESGDPAVNTLKTALIEYQVGNKTFNVKGNDPDTVYLTGDTAPITIEKALYGVLDDPARTRDVRGKLQHLVDTGVISFQVTRMAEGDDPAVNVVKTLALEYTVAGKHVSTSATDASRVILYEAESPAGILAFASGRKGRPLLEARENGHYEIRHASGTTTPWDVQDLPGPVEITGPWNVVFDPAWGAPEHVRFEKLISWSEHSDPGVRYYSGPATYTKSFPVSQDLLAKGRHIYLDLGGVQVMALVTVNGKVFDTLWKPPYRLDVTKALRAGENQLEVKVVNLWVNRLIGDEQLPEDSERNPEGTLKQWPQWLLDNQPSPTGRSTFTTWRLWKKDAPLQPSGLIGPVTLQACEVFQGK